MYVYIGCSAIFLVEVFYGTQYRSILVFEKETSDGLDQLCTTEKFNSRIYEQYR